MVSEDFQTHVIVKALRSLGYSQIANNLLQEYTAKIQKQQAQEIPTLLNWFHHALRTHNYQTIDQYLLKCLEETQDESNFKATNDFIKLTNYQGTKNKSVISLVLYMIRRFNFYQNRNKVDELKYISNQLLPLIESIDTKEEYGEESIYDLFDHSILQNLTFEQESKLLLNKNIDMDEYFFNIAPLEDDIHRAQDVIFQKLFILSPIIFNSITNVPALSQLIDYAVKYKQSQVPLYLPPRSKQERKGRRRNNSNSNNNSNNSTNNIITTTTTTSSTESDPFQFHNFNVTKLLHTLTHHLDEVWFLKFSPSGKFLVTGSLDGRMMLYDVHDKFRLIKALEPTNAADETAFSTLSAKPSSGKTKAVIYCCWDPNEQYIVSCCLDTVVRVWQIGDIHKKRITRSEAQSLSSEIKLVTCFTLGQDIKTWSCEFLPHIKEVTLSDSAAAAADAAASSSTTTIKTPQFIIGSPDKVLKIFDCHGREIFDFYSNIDEDNEPFNFRNHHDWTSTFPHDEDIELDPSKGSTLSGRTRGLGDAPPSGDDDVSMKSIDETTSAATGGAAGAGTGATSSSTSRANLTNGDNAIANENPFYRINDLAVTPDGRILITANNDQQLHFFSIPDQFNEESTTRKLAEINLKGRLTSCSVSQNGKYVLVSSAPDELQIWDISPLYNYKPPILYRKYIGHSQSSYIVRSSFGYLNEETGEEELVLSGSDDGFVYFWKLHTGQLITRIKAHVDLCNAVDWNLRGVYTKNIDYGKLWGSVGDDKLVKIWGCDEKAKTKGNI
ncbi:hypothetical protein PVL30_005337 [Lodderomyces elongisporus]|uniref:uncharacterized protein n=1 Tax=Lodderomyces elongisporus TaxID=36914 RepID=UPI00292519ED|nr:uncharacterized protein PVL30_005337 [Lodderomyces elongisporus]WLF81539.1 hypothetical protein PVL30_005337 [Lodderomyces elongisporus]